MAAAAAATAAAPAPPATCAQLRLASPHLPDGASYLDLLLAALAALTDRYIALNAWRIPDSCMQPLELGAFPKPSCYDTFRRCILPSGEEALWCHGRCFIEPSTPQMRHNPAPPRCFLLADPDVGAEIYLVTPPITAEDVSLSVAAAATGRVVTVRCVTPTAGLGHLAFGPYIYASYGINAARKRPRPPSKASDGFVAVTTSTPRLYFTIE